MTSHDYNHTPSILILQVWRMFHAGITSCLPLSIYIFCRNATGNRDISMISCILVASSTHLWVFGTHTFLNSFVSPFVFIILGYLTSFLTALSKEKNTENCEETYKKDMEHNNNIQIQQNGNGAVHNSPFSVHQLKSNSVKKVSRTDFSPCNVFLMGYFTGLFIYMRPDLCVLLITVLSPHIPSVLVRFKHIISHFELYVCIVSSVMGILTGALDDFLSYGRFVVTPLQWLSFNVLNGYAKRMFGTMPNSFYIHMFFGNITLIFLSLCIICVFVYTINKSSVVLVFLKKSLFSFTSLFIIYSYQGHKEARFLHDAIVVFYICSGVSLYVCVQEISYRLRSFCDSRYMEHVTHWFLLLWFISSQYQMMPNSRDNSIKLWAYEEKTDSHDVNVCLDFISQQTEVTGVFIDRDMHMTGGYSILKKNIPWFSLINTEFREFSKKSRLELQSFYGTRKVSTTSQISNYIHIQNTPFLLKCLIRQKEYNYLVMKITRQFINQGYVEVFRYGTMRVLKRTNDLQEEKMLATLERTISDSKNSTVLKYEGQWLAMYGNYDLAKEKFSRAAEIQSDLQVHQFLIELHRKISEPENTKAVFKNCLQKFSSDDCLKPAEKIALFEHERITLR